MKTNRPFGARHLAAFLAALMMIALGGADDFHDSKEYLPWAGPIEEALIEDRSRPGWATT